MKFFKKGQKKSKIICAIILCLVAISGIVIYLNNAIFGTDEVDHISYDPIGSMIAQVRLYDLDGEKVTITKDDISIYKKSDLFYSEIEGKYKISWKSKKQDYNLYGDMFSIPLNIYPDKDLKNSYEENDIVNFNIEISEKPYEIALFDKYNTIFFNDYSDLVKITEEKTSLILNRTQNQTISEIPSILDDYVIMFNNKDIDGLILEITFKKANLTVNASYSTNKLAKVTYNSLNNNKELNMLSDNSIKVEKQIIKEPRTLIDYGETEDYSEAVEEYLEKNIDYNTNKIYYKVKNKTLIRSILDGGILEKVNDSTVKIIYSDSFYVLYENIILCIEEDEEVNCKDIIGVISPGKKLAVTYVFNEKAELCEWMFDRFPEAEIGIPMTQMLQGDEEWGEEAYGNSTLRSSACGPSSFSMVLSYLKGELYTPFDVVSHMYEMGNESFDWCYLPGEGSYWGIFSALSEEYEIGCEEIFVDKDSITKALEEEKIVIICVKAGTIYLGDGHFIVLRGITEDGNFLINDSANCFKLNEIYTYEDLGPITMARALYSIEPKTDLKKN